MVQTLCWGPSWTSFLAHSILCVNWQSQGSHWAGTRGGDSHCPSRLLLHSLQTDFSSCGSRLMGACLPLKPNSLGTPPLGTDPGFPSPFHPCLSRLVLCPYCSLLAEASPPTPPTPRDCLLGGTQSFLPQSLLVFPPCLYPFLSAAHQPEKAVSTRNPIATTLA